MTISIIQTLNEEKLKNEIREYEKTNRRLPYLFMNIDTMKDLGVVFICFNKKLYDKNVYEATYSTTYGVYKVFCLEDLSYGEVELR